MQEQTFEEAALFARVSELMFQYNNVARVARELNLNYFKVYRALGEIKNLWLQRAMASRDAWVAEQIAKLDRIEEVLWPMVTAGGLTAVDRLIPVIQERNKMLGLNAPTKVDVTAKIRQMAIDNGLDPDEAVREADRLISGGLLSQE